MPKELSRRWSQTRHNHDDALRQESNRDKWRAGMMLGRRWEKGEGRRAWKGEGRGRAKGAKGGWGCGRVDGRAGTKPRYCLVPALTTQNGIEAASGSPPFRLTFPHPPCTTWKGWPVQLWLVLSQSSLTPSACTPNLRLHTPYASQPPFATSPLVTLHFENTTFSHLNTRLSF